MKIKNYKTYNALMLLCTDIFIIIIMTLVSCMDLVIYMSDNHLKYTVQNLTTWLLNADHGDLTICIILAFLGVAAIPIIIAYHFESLRNFRKNLHLEYVEILPNIVKFNYTKPEYSFSCAPSDIQRLHLDISTVLCHSKYKSYYACDTFTLNFELINGQKISIEQKPFLSALKPLYKIIDASRQIKKFEFTITGGGEPIDLREKMEKYLDYRYKDSLGKESKSNYSKLSWAFFGIGFACITIFNFVNSDKTTAFYDFFSSFNIIFTFFILIAIFYDFTVVKDTIRDNQIKKAHNKHEEPIGNQVSSLIIKLIVLAIFFFSGIFG